MDQNLLFQSAIAISHLGPRYMIDQSLVLSISDTRWHFLVIVTQAVFEMFLRLANCSDKRNKCRYLGVLFKESREKKNRKRLLLLTEA
jgi:hypothetical protein